MAAIVGRINARNSISLQFFNFLRKNNTSASTENFDMAASAIFQQIEHIFEILHMPALVGSYSNSLNIFLYGAIHNFLYLPVVPQMDHLHASTLQYSAHYVDCRIVPVEQ